MDFFQKKARDTDTKIPIIYSELLRRDKERSRPPPALVKCHVYLIWATYVILVLFLGALILGAYLCVDENHTTCHLLKQPIKFQIAVFDGGSNGNSTKNSPYLFLGKMSRASDVKDEDISRVDYFHFYVFLILVFLFTFLIVCLPVVAHLLSRHVEKGSGNCSRTDDPVKSSAKSDSNGFFPLVLNPERKEGIPSQILI